MHMKVHKFGMKSKPEGNVNEPVPLKKNEEVFCHNTDIADLETFGTSNLDKAKSKKGKSSKKLLDTLQSVNEMFQKKTVGITKERESGKSYETADKTLLKTVSSSFIPALKDVGEGRSEKSEKDTVEVSKMSGESSDEEKLCIEESMQVDGPKPEVKSKGKKSLDAGSSNEYVANKNTETEKPIAKEELDIDENSDEEGNMVIDAQVKEEKQSPARCTRGRFQQLCKKDSVLQKEKHEPPKVRDIPSVRKSEDMEEDTNDTTLVTEETKPKRGRGRPPKRKSESVEEEANDTALVTEENKPKRGRGRPPKRKSESMEEDMNVKNGKECEITPKRSLRSSGSVEDSEDKTRPRRSSRHKSKDQEETIQDDNMCSTVPRRSLRCTSKDDKDQEQMDAHIRSGGLEKDSYDGSEKDKETNKQSSEKQVQAETNQNKDSLRRITRRSQSKLTEEPAEEGGKDVTMTREILRSDTSTMPKSIRSRNQEEEDKEEDGMRRFRRVSGRRKATIESDDEEHEDVEHNVIHDVEKHEEEEHNVTHDDDKHEEEEHNMTHDEKHKEEHNVTHDEKHEEEHNMTHEKHEEHNVTHDEKHKEEYNVTHDEKHEEEEHNVTHGEKHEEDEHSVTHDEKHEEEHNMTHDEKYEEEHNLTHDEKNEDEHNVTHDEKHEEEEHNMTHDEKHEDEHNVTHDEKHEEEHNMRHDEKHEEEHNVTHEKHEEDEHNMIHDDEKQEEEHDVTHDNENHEEEEQYVMHDDENHEEEEQYMMHDDEKHEEEEHNVVQQKHAAMDKQTEPSLSKQNHPGVNTSEKPAITATFPLSAAVSEVTMPGAKRRQAGQWPLSTERKKPTLQTTLSPSKKVKRSPSAKDVKDKTGLPFLFFSYFYLRSWFGTTFFTLSYSPTLPTITCSSSQSIQCGIMAIVVIQNGKYEIYLNLPGE